MLTNLNAYWRACNYLAAGMIYLQENPLLEEPLCPEHIKNRLLGHWRASPGLSITYVHMNRLIKEYDLNANFLAGPGHGIPGVLAPVYLEGAYSEIYPYDNNATSMAFMLPVATPPNAMVHATGKVTQGDMIRAGFRLNLAAIAVITLLFHFGVAG